MCPRPAPPSQSFERASSALKVPLRAIGPYFPSASGTSTDICREVGCRSAPCMKSPGGGNGAIDGAAAALFAGGIAARTRGKVLWCVTRQDLFAPALAQAGLAPDRVIYVEAGDEKTVLACFEEGLRHGGLGAVVAEVARLSMTASRRLQLAAEELRRDRDRGPPLAAADRGGRFRSADGRPSPAGACRRLPSTSVAGAGRRTRRAGCSN